MGSCSLRYQKRLRLLELNYGRDAGWIVERDGEPVAVLSDACFGEMFWDSYTIEIVTADQALRDRMEIRDFWMSNEPLKFTYRNREALEVVTGVLPSYSIREGSDRVWMRGLYFQIEPCLWDWIALRLRRCRLSRLRAREMESK